MHNEQDVRELNLGDRYRCEVDEEGFLLVFQHHEGKWVAHFAKKKGYIRGATKDMKTAIKATCICFERKGSMPTLAEITKEAGFKVMYLGDIFPSAPARMLPLIAVLPCALKE